MKTLLKIGLCLLLAVHIAACDKEDENRTIGHLTISTYSSKSIDTHIYTELESSIFSVNGTTKTTDLDLNAGNYSIGVYNDSSSGIIKANFQIRADRTTKITCDEQLNIHVLYK